MHRYSPPDRKEEAMIEVGVSDMAIYIPPFYLAHEDLARARGVPSEKYHAGLGNYKMSIIPNWEDAVTMAANAAHRLLEKTGTDPNEIQQLVVSTESGVDHSKPVASFVQGLLNIGSRCRVYEIKHACYGGTAGIVHSIDWIARNHTSRKKALVIMTDIARYAFGSAGEPTQGAGAVALLVERDPRLFSINTSLNGIFSKDVFDFWRPTGHRVPIVDGKYSVECYLMALEGACSHFRSNLGIEKGKLLEVLDYVIYHMPFSTMARKAHRHLIDIEYDDLDPASREHLFTETFTPRVEPGLLGVREVGNIYTGSVYMGLISLLETEREHVEGKQVGIFSYGSGCGAEFFLCQMKTGTTEIINGLQFHEQLERRRRITFEQYVQIYSKTWEETLYHPGEVQAFKNSFTRHVFIGFKDHKRQYL
jgi:hydroxymethylglutaryl-CoA synthase